LASHRLLFGSRSVSVFHITAITHRKDALYPATLWPPPQEDAYLGKATERIFCRCSRWYSDILDMDMPSKACFTTTSSSRSEALRGTEKSYPHHLGTGMLMLSNLSSSATRMSISMTIRGD